METCARFVHAINDSSHRSSNVFCVLAFGFSSVFSFSVKKETNIDLDTKYVQTIVYYMKEILSAEETSLAEERSMKKPISTDRPPLQRTLRLNKNPSLLFKENSDFNTWPV